MVATSNKLWLVSGTGDRQLSYASYIPSKMRSHEVASACCRAAALSSGGPFHGRLHRLRGLASGGGSRGQACAPRHLGARADVPEQTKGRYALIELARTKGLRAVNNFLFPLIVHESRNDDRGLRPIVDSMAEDAGVEAFVRQQTATWVAPIRVPICRRSAVPPSLSSAIPTRSLRPTSPGK